MLIPLLKAASLACLFVVLNSCNDDLILVEPSKEATPVIYGFLSLNDTATYLRVERSFVSTQKSATDLAKVADSLTYPANVEVYLIRTSSNERYLLQKVDGNTEGYRRDTGAFATTPNYLYKVKNSILQLKGNEDWRVEVQRKGETKPLAKASTRVISTYDIVSPLGMNVASSFAVSFETKTDGTLRSDIAARYYSARIIFNYEETVGGTTAKKNVVWQMLSNEKRVGTPDPTYDQQNFSKNGRDFYEFLGNNIPVTAGASRIFKDMEIEITGGGQEVADLLSVGLANLGITGSQTIPIYSNVVDGAGVTALGILGSRYRFSKKGFFLNDGSLEELKTGTYTKQLNFR
ncbi:MAG: hypothetical protein U5L45_06430 [Saprospiraceae bacterium]|nr:hypothetical protein [Saprospiraceae bacterium]